MSRHHFEQNRSRVESSPINKKRYSDVRNDTKVENVFITWRNEWCSFLVGGDKGSVHTTGKANNGQRLGSRW